VMIHYRDALRRIGILSTGQVKRARAGRRVQVAGMVVVRQRPSTAKGVTFLSLEDEQGLLDVVLQPPVYERFRHTLRQTPLLVITGVVQRADRAVSLLAHDLQALMG
jgi:error-prone DNA polymerase